MAARRRHCWAVRGCRPSMGARTAGGRSWASWTNAVVRLGRMGMWWAARRRDRALAEMCRPGPDAGEEPAAGRVGRPPAGRRPVGEIGQESGGGFGQPDRSAVEKDYRVAVERAQRVGGQGCDAFHEGAALGVVERKAPAPLRTRPLLRVHTTHPNRRRKPAPRFVARLEPARLRARRNQHVRRSQVVGVRLKPLQCTRSHQLAGSLIRTVRYSTVG